MARKTEVSYNTPHLMYLDNYPRWKRCRDAIEGSDAVKAAGEAYLPKLTKQTAAEYRAYKMRANFVNLTARALDGLVGMVTRKKPKATYPDSMSIYFKDATNTSISFDELFINIVNEVLITGRVPLIADRSSTPDSRSRAYIVPYTAESLINWYADPDTGKLIFAVFEESFYKPVDNVYFNQMLAVRYRVLMINMDGNYQVDVYEFAENTKKLTLISTAVPTNTGLPMKNIPLVVITPNGLGYDIAKPPILDMVDVNLSHYRTSADLEHGRHFTALPTPVVSGVNSDTELRIGSNTAWVLPDKDASASYLEFKGEGLKSLEKALEEKQMQIAQFSVRLMDTSQRGSESTDAVKLRYSGEAASLISIAYAVEKGLNDIYAVLSEMEGNKDEAIVIELNKDFTKTKMTPAELRELSKALLDGTMTKDQFVYNLRQGEMIPD